MESVMKMKQSSSQPCKADFEDAPIEYEVDAKRKIIVSPVYQVCNDTGKSINEILINLMRREAENL